MPIFANHAHVAPPDALPHATVDDLLRLMDQCGIERAVCFAPFGRQFEAAGRGDDPNAWLAEAIADRDELIGYATLAPQDPASIPALDRAVSLGLRGVKLHPAIDLFDLTDPRCLDFYAAATALGLPLDFHTAPHHAPLRAAEVLKHDEIAWAVPGAVQILEHAGGRPFFTDALAVLANHHADPPRVYTGITSVLNPAHRVWYLGPERVEELARVLGSGVLIYGLDFPYNSAEEIREELRLCRELDLGPGGLEALLGGNLARLLGVSGD
jgi:predicted TIM-barrel fold metal-dependent hydrolase